LKRSVQPPNGERYLLAGGRTNQQNRKMLSLGFLNVARPTTKSAERRVGRRHGTLTLLFENEYQTHLNGNDE
jgi:hypothetical protein